jgi:predicted RecB family nuclease
MLAPPRHILSKSTFMKGCQCPKALWMYKHQPDYRAAVSNSQQAIFDQGTSVGKLAEQLFPGGVNARPVDTYSYQQSVVDTFNYVQAGQKVIYEAAFQHDQVLAALDILVKKRGKWQAFEVKSSTSVKDTFLQDAALQYYVITQAGLPLVDFSIVYINNEYERYGDLDIAQLFTIESVLDQILELQPQIAAKIPQLKEVLKQKTVPEQAIGPHCSDPYACDFTDHCCQHLPVDSVFDLRGHSAGAKSFDLYEQGIHRLLDIPDDYPLNGGQLLQVQCHKTGEPHIDQEELNDFLAQLEYPLYFMDFETYQVAVPEWDGTRPYQQIPFQYSVHRQDSPGEPLTHFEWLAQSGTDPRKEFLANLLNVMGTTGTILAYNSSFENSRLNDLAYWFPRKAKAIEALQERMVDLMSPFRSKHYYLPAMKGSYSIKQVLPALVPNMNYDELEIGNGGDASTAFYQLQFEKDASVVEQTREALLRYCAMDTEAMVRVLEELKQRK